MGHPSAKRNDSGVSKKRERGIVGSSVYFVWLIMCTSGLAWFLMGIGFALYQIKEGEDKAQYQINRILDANIAVLKNGNHFLVSKADLAFESAEKVEKSALNTALAKAQTVDTGAWVSQKIGYGAKSSHETLPDITRVKNNVVNGWHRIFYPVVTVFQGTASIIGTRLFIFFLSGPFVLLCVFLGLVDGLVQRDIRKFQAARESTYLFHRIKKMWKPFFFVPLFFYFACPLVVSFLWFLLPMVIGLSVLIKISLQSFKKYV
jgi:integrating conjugative element membrane protein (TIGR03747 family)